MTLHHLVSYDDDNIGETHVVVYHDADKAKAFFDARMKSYRSSVSFMNENPKYFVYLDKPTLVSIEMECPPPPVELLDGQIRTVTTIYGAEFDGCVTD